MRNLIALIALFTFRVISLKAQSPTIESFDANQAFLHVKKQVEFGPRPSGSEELLNTRIYIESTLKRYGYEIQEQPFDETTPRGKIHFVNIRANLPGSGSSFFFVKPRLIIASHYDTKWFKDFRFLGADDGGSSTGILLELARVVSSSKTFSKLPLEFVFFDGEEAVVDFTDTDGLYGSRYFAEHLKKSDVEGLILLDMVGDQELSVMVSNDGSALSSRIFQAAEALRYRDSFHPMLERMIDDHTPFVKAGIPAIDLIDFDYGPGNRFWHTDADSLDKISPASLKILGQTMLKFLEHYDSSK